jgi:hypothetical protein
MSLEFMWFRGASLSVEMLGTVPWLLLDDMSVARQGKNITVPYYRGKT